MRTAACSLFLLASPVCAQQVADCDGVPAVTDLVEPWEETSVLLGEGAIRLALLHGAGEEGVKLLVLTLPPAEDAESGAEAGAEEAGTDDEALPQEAPALPPARCRIVTEGGLGFAGLDIAGVETAEDPEAATLTAALPALRFVPESTELEELTLSLTFGVGDDSIAATLEGDDATPKGEEAVPEDGEAAPGEDAE
jgi:hypothetical protein